MVLLLVGYKFISSSRMYGISSTGSAGFNAPSIPRNENVNDYANNYKTSNINSNSSLIGDTREFLKIGYNARIQTRNVKDITRDVKSIVREMDGRIDNLNESPKNVSIYFVIPKTNFENFRSEIESLTHEKLITENISSENLLEQKQSIEQRQEYSTTTLEGLQKEQKDLIAKHTQEKNKLQSEITTLQNKLYSMDPGPSGFDQESLIYRQDLSNQISQLNQKLSYENSNYNANNLNLKNKLNNVNNELKNIEKQDSVFTENVETVNGSIRINWISLWELSEIFLPVSPVVLIIIALLILGFFLKRKNYLPKIEFI
jgi:hypothetical protein